MSRALLSVVMILALVGVPGCAGPKQSTKKSDEEPERTEVEATPLDDHQLLLEADASNYHVAFHSEVYSKELHGPSVWWGAYIGEPRTIVTRLEVTKAGKRQPVLRGFFADLSNIHTLSASVVGGNLQIDFAGGSAANGYFGVITCDSNGMPMRREVHYGEFPEYDYDVYQRFLKPIPDD
jgi:hypothetical protein